MCRRCDCRPLSWTRPPTGLCADCESADRNAKRERELAKEKYEAWRNRER